VELVSFRANDFPPEFAKGYGECLLMDTALSKSSLLAESPYFAKLTGRHLLRNMTRVVAKTKGDYELLCDLRDHGIYEALRLPHSGRHFDTRFFVASRALYDEVFRYHYRQHEQHGYSIEGKFYTLAKSVESRAGVVLRFPVEPIYGGLSGHGKDYDSWSEQAKRLIRGTVRRCAPMLRI
jgi:hypothetical protein